MWIIKFYSFELDLTTLLLKSDLDITKMYVYVYVYT